MEKPNRVATAFRSRMNEITAGVRAWNEESVGKASILTIPFLVGPLSEQV
jgi:hypothetical protein